MFGKEFVQDYSSIPSDSVSTVRELRDNSLFVPGFQTSELICALLRDVARDGSFEFGREPADGLNEIRIVSVCFDRLNKGAAHNDAV